MWHKHVPENKMANEVYATTYKNVESICPVDFFLHYFVIYFLFCVCKFISTYIRFILYQNTYPVSILITLGIK